ncbi:MAG: type IV pilus assembly protein PilM [Phycisphaerales bacterium]|nr:MAG: type IV pilus assembly protein PilM [Phycisphaerales bacterium]
MDWNRNINITKNETLGLDIGSAAVKIVALRKNGEGYSALAAGIAEIAAANDDVIRHRTNTIRAVRSCFARTRIKRRLAVCGVSGPEVAVRDFELPLLAPEEMTAAVALEASQVCPFPAGASSVDYQLIPNDGDNAKGVLVAAMHSLIADKRELVKDARLKCVMMDVDGLALLNCFQGLANSDEKAEETETCGTVAILNVGHAHTTLAIMDEEGRPFIRDIAYAGDGILGQIIEEKGAPAGTIKEILSGGSAATELGLNESLARACQKLITDVNETLRYHTAQGKSASIDKLHVCGGFALAGGLIELLDRQISAECVLWNPFDQMHCNPNRKYKDLFAKRGPALAVAAGLAMRSIDTDD